MISQAAVQALGALAFLGTAQCVAAASVGRNQADHVPAHQRHAVPEAPDGFCDPADQQMGYSDMDAVIVMVAPVCTTYQVVQLLSFNYNFRRIYFVVKSHKYCPYLESLDPKVICLDENTVLPGITYKSLADKSPGLKKHQGVSNRVGWYLQQYLKLGVALHIPDLSDYYLVWDADNIPVKPIELFTEKPNQVRPAVRFCANPVSYKSQGYIKFYKHMTGMQLMKPGGYPKDPKGNSFNYVCGYMVMYRPYVRELVDFTTSYLRKKEPWIPEDMKEWPWNVHALGNWLIESNVFFSEYDSYGSWVQLKHPEEHDIDFAVQYVRNPGIPMSPAALPAPKKGGKGKGKAPAMPALERFPCCLTHKRICSLSRNSKSSVVNILIWEEHKMRYRTQDQCVDPLPPVLDKAVKEVGDGTNPDG